MNDITEPCTDFFTDGSIDELIDELISVTTRFKSLESRKKQLRNACAQRLGVEGYKDDRVIVTVSPVIETVHFTKQKLLGVLRKYFSNEFCDQILEEAADRRRRENTVRVRMLGVR